MTHGAQGQIKLTNFVSGSITVQLTSCFTGQHSAQTSKSVTNFNITNQLNPK